jgi:hypothetical protein
MIKDIEAMNEQISKDLETLEHLIKDYNSKPEDFDGLYASVAAWQAQEWEKLWSERSEMLRHIESVEWQQIIGAAQAKMEQEKKE